MEEKRVNITGVPNGVLRHLSPEDQKYGYVLFQDIMDACFYELSLVRNSKNAELIEVAQPTIIAFAKKMCGKVDHTSWLYEYQKYLGLENTVPAKK